MKRRFYVSQYTYKPLKIDYLCKCITIFMLCATLFVACSAPKPPAVRAYYFWKSDFRLSPNEQRQLFDTLHITKLYLKYFDVAWSAAQNAPSPLDNMQIETVLPKNVSVVPTVFITNETLQRIDSSQTDMLAKRIATKIIEKTANAKLTAQVREWQIDCDWSAKTKNKYFAFLNCLKTYFPNKNLRISATIEIELVESLIVGLFCCNRKCSLKQFKTKLS